MKFVVFASLFSALWGNPSRAHDLPPSLVADGATDNTQYIQKMLHKAAQSGGTVTIPEAEEAYVVEGALVVPKDVTLEVNGTLQLKSYKTTPYGTLSQIQLSENAHLSGTGTILMADNANAQCMIYASGNNSIGSSANSNLTLNSNRAGNIKPANAFISAVCVMGNAITISGVTFLHSATRAIFIPGSTVMSPMPNGVTITGNTATDTGGEFIAAGNGTCVMGNMDPTNLTISNNTYDSGIAMGSFGINLNQINGATISGNTGSAGSFGLNVMGIDNSKNITVKNNTVSDSVAEEILFWADAPGSVVSNNVISGNTFKNAGSIAMGLLDYTNVPNGNGPGCGKAGNPPAEISNNTIADNQILNANTPHLTSPYYVSTPAGYDVGIRLEGFSTFTGNTVSNNSCSSTVVGTSPVRNGWNSCVGLDGNISPSSNFVYGNQVTVADSPTTFCYVRDVTAAVGNVCFTSNPQGETVTQGFYQMPGNPVIYYSNGVDSYCALSSWDNFLAGGGKSDGSNITRIYNLPIKMRNDGTCAPPK